MSALEIWGYSIITILVLCLAALVVKVWVVWR